MSASTHVEAIIPVDGVKFRAMQQVLLACEQAGVPPPEEAEAFFYDDGEVSVDDVGRHVKIPETACVGHIESEEGVLIDLAQLPPDATKLRVWTLY